MLIPLAAILLLLTWDPVILRALSPRRRYFLPTLALAASLSWAACVEVWEDYVEEGLMFRWAWFSPVVSAVIQVCLMVLTWPNLLFLLRFLWDGTRVRGQVLLITTPTSLLAAVLGVFQPQQLLAGSACVAAGLLLVQMRVLAQRANRLI